MVGNSSTNKFPVEAVHSVCRSPKEYYRLLKGQVLRHFCTFLSEPDLAFSFGSEEKTDSTGMISCSRAAVVTGVLDFSEGVTAVE